MKDRLFSQDDSVNAVVKKRKREFKEELQEEKSLRYGIDQDDDDDDHYGELGPQNIVMSVSHQSGRLGVAYFNSENGEFGWGETNETGNLNSLEYVKFQINPNMIITPSSTDRMILGALKKPVSDNREDIDVKILKSSDFSYDGAKSRLLVLRKVIGNDKDTFDGDQLMEENYMYGLSTIDVTENKQMVRAAGGLLCYMQNNRLQFGELDETDVLKCIKVVKSIAFTGFMQLDMNTLNALAIFKVDRHPCASMRIGVSKEGFSLFGILNKTRSPPGKEMLRQWFLQPVLDMDVLTERYDAIDYFMKNRDVVDHLRDLIKNIRNTKRIMKRIKESTASANDWCNLYKTLYCFTQVCSVCFDDDRRAPEDNGREVDIKLLRKLSELMVEEVVGLVQTMSKVIDFRESKEQDRIVIMPGVDSSLDRKKQIHENLDSILTEVAEQIIKGLPEGFPELTVCYFPGMGFFIGIPLSVLTNRENTKEVKMVEQYLGDTFAFNSNETAYFDNYVMRAMNTEYGDIHEDIIVIERGIMANMDKYVTEHDTIIHRVTDLLAEMDCILALSKCAIENQYTRPNLTEDSVIYIENGRNPVQEMAVNTFIPNDTSVKTNESRVNIITGPNNSGKSVYLRQVGHIVFMAHIGSFVPADSCTIGLTDRIMSRMQSHDSISVHQSTFATDLLQINAMTKDATERSLLLIDEFGKGTLALDGIALLSSTLNHMVALGETCPKVFCSTHYTEMFEHDLVDLKNPLFQLWSMQTVVERQLQFQEEDYKGMDPAIESGVDMDLSRGDELIFLYKLHKGTATHCYAHAIAYHAGVPIELLNRARDVQERLSRGEVVERLDNDVTRARMKMCTKIVDRFAKVDTESVQSVLDFVSWIVRNDDQHKAIHEEGEDEEDDGEDYERLSTISEDLMDDHYDHVDRSRYSDDDAASRTSVQLT